MRDDRDEQLRRRASLERERDQIRGELAQLEQEASDCINSQGDRELVELPDGMHLRVPRSEALAAQIQELRDELATLQEEIDLVFIPPEGELL